MQKILATLLGCGILVHSFGQTQRKVSVYLQGQYNHTLYDYTSGNNPWAMGLGLQTFFSNKKKLKPTLDITADAYLYNDKVLYANPDGTFPKDGNDVGGMVNVFGGFSYHPVSLVYAAVTAGPSFIRQQTLFGIKPSVGFYFSKTQRVTGKVSYINVFDRTKIGNKDFGTLSLAIGVRLF